MNHLATAGAFLGLFVGSAAAGAGLARLFAPASWLAAIVSFFALPVAFAAALQLWHGLALLGMLYRLFHRAVLADRPPTKTATTPGSLPGSVVFLPLSSAAGLLAGLLVGLVSSSTPGWVVVMVYWVLGTVHGLVAWGLARKGVLLPPESV